jgi:hypothetical protein
LCHGLHLPRVDGRVLLSHSLPRGHDGRQSRTNG